MISIACLRAQRLLLLECDELARDAIVDAKRWIDADDAVDVHARVALWEAAIALALGSTSEDEVERPLDRSRELLRSTEPKHAAVAGMLLGAFWRQRGSFKRAITAYRVAATDARTAGDAELAGCAELAELAALVEGEVEQFDAPDRLRGIADQAREAGQTQREAVARTDLGRCLLRRGLRQAAVVELERARACFAATTDAAAELSVAQLLGAASQ
jgi:hypothetical protein